MFWEFSKFPSQKTWFFPGFKPGLFPASQLYMEHVLNLTKIILYVVCWLVEQHCQFFLLFSYLDFFLKTESIQVEILSTSANELLLLENEYEHKMHRKNDNCLSWLCLRKKKKEMQRNCQNSVRFYIKIIRFYVNFIEVQTRFKITLIFQKIQVSYRSPF